MVELKPQSVSLATTHGHLRIEFQWEVDRFAQKIFLGAEQVGISVEGDADDAWPPSPPLQQISLQEINDSQVILGVGAAGKGHWSLSVELANDHDPPSIKFDWACRSNDPPVFLGSTYRLLDSVAVHATDANSETPIREQSGRQIVRAVLSQDRTHRWSYVLRSKST